MHLFGFKGWQHVFSVAHPEGNKNPPRGNRRGKREGSARGGGRFGGGRAGCPKFDYGRGLSNLFIGSRFRRINGLLLSHLLDFSTKLCQNWVALDWLPPSASQGYFYCSLMGYRRINGFTVCEGSCINGKTVTSGRWPRLFDLYSTNNK